jgi:hypothetical protein
VGDFFIAKRDESMKGLKIDTRQAGIMDVQQSNTTMLSHFPQKTGLPLGALVA